MLDEMEQALGRLHGFGLSSSWAVQNFSALHETFRCDLERIQTSVQHPRIMRILAEECVERIEGVFDRLEIGLNTDKRKQLPYWSFYLMSIKSGALLDHEYTRYLAAKKLADLFLKYSYLPEYDISDYKWERYAYALTDHPLPDWFVPDEVMGWMEEIITAYCFLWFAVMDHAEETYHMKGA